MSLLLCPRVKYRLNNLFICYTLGQPQLHKYFKNRQMKYVTFWSRAVDDLIDTPEPECDTFGYNLLQFCSTEVTTLVGQNYFVTLLVNGTFTFGTGG